MTTFRDIKTALLNATESMLTRLLRPHAIALAEDIRRRTRLGYGVRKRGGEKERLKSLTSEAYIKIRRKAGGKKNRRLSSFTSPKKSNLTFTGQLLDMIFGFIPKKGVIRISIKENRDDGVLNRDIVQGQKDQGRPFFHATNLELKRLKNSIKKDLKTSMTRQLKGLKGK